MGTFHGSKSQWLGRWKVYIFRTLTLAVFLLPFMYESVTPEPVQYGSIPQKSLSRRNDLRQLAEVTEEAIMYRAGISFHVLI